MKVFVSATSGDLKTCRQAVKDVLLQSNIQPVTQEVLPADHRDLPEFLDALVQSCDAVVCLIGKVFGAAPQDRPERSYTQLEYDCAKRLGKPVFVFMAADSFYGDQAPRQPARDAKLQQTHCNEVMNEQYCRTFKTQLELEKEIAVAASRIRASAGGAPMFYLHLPTSREFVGRAREKAQLLKAMSTRRPGVIVVVGMAGQGKSSLVHNVISSRQEDAAFPFHAGLWCAAEARDFSFDMFLDETLAYLTDGQFDKNAEPRTHQRVQRLLSEMQRRPVLIVIDAIERWLRGWAGGDADQDDVSDEDRIAAAEGLDDLLVQATALSSGSHLLITSRAMPESLEDVDKIIIPVLTPTSGEVGLQGLDPPDATALLKSFGVDGSDARLEMLAAQLGYHPLAIRVFGGYVQREYGGALDETTNLTTWDRKKTLARLFDEVQRRLPGKEASQRFLAVASCAIGQTRLEAIRAVLGPDSDDAEWTARRIALTLADWQVISFNARSGTVAIHALLKEHFAKQLDPPDRAELHRRFAQWYGDQPISEAPATLGDVKARLLSMRHALAAGDLERCERIVWGNVTPLYCLAEWMDRFGHFVHGAELLDELARAARDRLAARARIARAALLRPIGRHTEAVDDLAEAIAILDDPETRQPSDIADLAGALSNRGTVFLDLTLYSRAIDDLDRAVELLQPGDTESGAFQLAGVYANRAMVLREMGRVRKAVDDCSTAIDIHRTHLEPLYQQLNSELASALTNRGNAYRDLRRCDEAMADYQAASAIHTNMVNLGQLQFRGPRALGRILIGTVLQIQLRHRQAIDHFDQAVKTYRDLIESDGQKHLEPMLAFALTRRSWSLAANGEATDALGCITEACDLYERLARDQRRDILGPRANATLVDAMIHYICGDMQEGLDRWKNAIARTMALIGDGEIDLRILIVRYSIELCLAAVDRDSDLAGRLVAEALDVAGPAILGNEPTDALEVETHNAIRRLRNEVAMEALPIDWGGIEAMDRELSARIDPPA